MLANMMELIILNYGKINLNYNANAKYNRMGDLVEVLTL